MDRVMFVLGVLAMSVVGCTEEEQEPCRQYACAADCDYYTADETLSEIFPVCDDGTRWNGCICCYDWTCSWWFAAGSWWEDSGCIESESYCTAALERMVCLDGHILHYTCDHACVMTSGTTSECR